MCHNVTTEVLFIGIASFMLIFLVCVCVKFIVLIGFFLFILLEFVVITIVICVMCSTVQCNSSILHVGVSFTVVGIIMMNVL